MKRMILAAILALAAHALAFKINMPWAKPVLRMETSNAVTINLIALPPVRPETTASLPASKPQPPKPLVRKKPPKPSVMAQPSPLPTPVVEPKPQPQVDLPAPDSPEPEPVHAVSNTFQEDPPPATSAAPYQTHEAATVTVSVPLHDLNPQLTYPALARRRNYQGTALLDVLVAADGRPVEVKVSHSSGYAILDEDAVREVKKWRFIPALRGGTPIEMWVQQPVRYVLQ